MNKMEDLLSVFDFMKKKEDADRKHSICCILGVIAAIAAVVAIRNFSL